jgi:hypothetical protein
MFQGLMVVGFDVCHDSKARNMSFGALVASLDKQMSRYFSAVSHHSSGEELSNNVTAHMASKPPVHTFLIFFTSVSIDFLCYVVAKGLGSIPRWYQIF